MTESVRKRRIARPATVPPAEPPVSVPDTDAAATAPEPPSAGVSSGALRKLQADMTISKHVLFASSAGFIPLPVIDYAAIVGIQIDLLYRLCRLYEVDFSTQIARGLVTSLLGGAVAGALYPLLVGSALKVIPGIGSTVAVFATPALAGAVTYAIGLVFVEHLERGGTLLTFDASKAKARFQEALGLGTAMVSDKPKPGAPRVRA